MKKEQKEFYRTSSGFTLIEVLIAVALTSIISLAALSFYVTQHNSMLVQYNVSDVQQNLRASMEEVTFELRNAGSNLPSDLIGISSTNSNPDTLVIRYAGLNARAIAGNFSAQAAAAPIQFPAGTNLSEFSVGDVVYLWHTAIKTGEWFTISNIVTKDASGWDKVFHQGQDLTLNVLAGDFMIKLQETKYFVDMTNPTNLTFLRAANNGVPDVYAENIYDFQTQFYLTTLDTVDILGPADTALVVSISMSGRTSDADVKLADQGKDPYRRRTMTTEVQLRNSRR